VRSPDHGRRCPDLAESKTETYGAGSGFNGSSRLALRTRLASTERLLARSRFCSLLASFVSIATAMSIRIANAGGSRDIFRDRLLPPESRGLSPLEARNARLQPGIPRSGRPDCLLLRNQDPSGVHFRGLRKWEPPQAANSLPRSPPTSHLPSRSLRFRTPSFDREHFVSGKPASNRISGIIGRTRSIMFSCDRVCL
jgi:hypothetical protein